MRKGIIVNWVMAMKSARWTSDVMNKMDKMATLYSHANSVRKGDGRVCYCRIGNMFRLVFGIALGISHLQVYLCCLLGAIKSL